MSTSSIGSGQSATSQTIGAGETLDVLSGGSAVATAVTSGGNLYVESGGSAIATTLTGEAFLYVSAGGSATGTTVGSGGVEYVSGGSVVSTHVDSGGAEYVISGGTASGTVVSGGGFAIVSSGGSADNITVDGGTLVDFGGTLTGAIVLGAGADLVIGGTVLPAATVGGFTSGVTIDFAGIAPASSGAITLDAANHRIAVVEAGGTQYLQLDPQENFTGDTLHYAPDTGSGTGTGSGTDVSLVVPACFAAGTLIATPDGEVPVELLQPGQLVRTLDGAAPVRWLGVQSISPRFADPLLVLPIRIRAGALGPDLPRRDLLVSPGHALLIDGLLVQAGALVNGTTIARVAGMAETYRYYHVELPTHAVIFAEGVAAESFLDGAEAFAFDNAAARRGGAAAVPLPYPRVMAPRQLTPPIRLRLAARAEQMAA